MLYALPFRPIRSWTVTRRPFRGGLRGGAAPVTIQYRMPAIVSQRSLAPWLDPDVATAAPLEGLFGPSNRLDLIAYPVDRGVSRTIWDDAALIGPIMQ